MTKLLLKRTVSFEHKQNMFKNKQNFLRFFYQVFKTDKLLISKKVMVGI